MRVAMNLTLAASKKEPLAEMVAAVSGGRSWHAGQRGPNLQSALHSWAKGW